MIRLLRSLRPLPTLTAAIAAALAPACGRPRNPGRGTIVVFNAGALALPLRQALDSFARADALAVRQESAGSVETARKITDLGRIPDVVALADTALFSSFLGGRIATPVAVLGRTRLVLAYTPESRFANEVTAANWPDVTTRPGVEVGRSDPSLDPAGYRALIAMQLAERYYRKPGLAAALERSAAPRFMRPKSADLVALLQTGNLDYAWEYEAVARRLGLRFVSLPDDVNLGDPGRASVYATGAVRLAPPGSTGTTASGSGPREPLVIHGAPIVFGAAVPEGAANPEAGRRFITYLMSPAGRAIFTGFGLGAGSDGAPSETR